MIFPTSCLRMIHAITKRLWHYAPAFLLGIFSLLVAEKIRLIIIDCPSDFDHLNPLIACEDKHHEISEWDYEPLRLQLRDVIDEYSESKTVPHISVFFRDLKNGPRFGIREYENFIPASLLKVPIMIALLHQADRDPTLLDQHLTLQDKGYINDFTTAKQTETLELNTAYPVRVLLEKMIKYSDNNSTFLLLDKINEYGLPANSNTFSDLGTMKLMNGRIDNTRLISLVNLYVTLYNASYLSKENSQLALKLLSQTTFTQGIVAGVPEGIRVAHKYGVDTVAEKGDELHDCGIVYHKSTPYVLCILTAGGDIKAESVAIQQISRLVYTFVDGLLPHFLEKQ